MSPRRQPSATDRRSDLVFAIHEGPQILIDHVLVVGNERTSRETILREVQLKSGQPLSQQQEDETRSRLTALGLFRRVDISYLQLPGEQNRRDVVITVEEAPVTTIGYGGGLEGGKRLVRSSETATRSRSFSSRRAGSSRSAAATCSARTVRSTCSRASASGPRASAPRPAPIRRRSSDDGGYGFNEYLARLTYGERRFSAPMPISRSAAVSSRRSGRASTSTGAARARRLRGASAARWPSAGATASTTRSC